jgi:phosphatidylinositol 4-kinase
MGRSFALEMGSKIPGGDQRLGMLTETFNLHSHANISDSIDNHGNMLVNVSSDFIAQYTTRQEYRYSEKSAVSDRDGWPLKSSQGRYPSQKDAGLGC